MRTPILGSLTALATPSRQIRVGRDGLSRLSRRQVAGGTAALIMCGSTCEAAALTQPEYARAVPKRSGNAASGSARLSADGTEGGGSRCEGSTASNRRKEKVERRPDFCPRDGSFR
jgi:hypothetical protein